MPSSAEEFLEFRVPTYRRPELLRRALASLRAQTDPRWRAVVLDDSPTQEGRAVVAALGDERITYRPNPTPLLAAGNLDFAFTPQPLLAGFAACVLEDDNAVAPNLVAVARARFAAGAGPVLSANQRSLRLDASLREEPIGVLRPHQTTDEVWGHEQLCLHAFLTRSLPNGGYIWRLGAGVDLSVGANVREPQLQECIRQTRVSAVTLLPEQLSIWSLLESTDIRRQLVSHRRLAANLSLAAAAIVRHLGADRLRALAAASGDPTLPAEVERRLADLGMLAPTGTFAQAPQRALRGWLRARFYGASLPDDFPTPA
jgi:hypothetical protein